ncbi:MAG TPA: hypothetical protein VGY48_15840 [Vicinamibacterales bacterium]|jgi:hypothetical protein|nr:hypothetical protein [Vicinamibacterales bacterium]
MMSLSLQLRIAMRCRACGKLDHDERCPIALMDKATEREPSWRCPKCLDVVHVTIDDFLQCRKCRTRFTLGIGAPEDAERVTLHKLMPDETFMPAQVLPGKKRTGFKLDVLLKSLRAQAAEWRRARKGQT